MGELFCPVCNSKLNKEVVTFNRKLTQREIESLSIFNGKEVGNVLIEIKNDEALCKANLFNCPKCDDLFCPNSPYHDSPQKLVKGKDRRGSYLRCKVCKWYPYIEVENILGAHAETKIKEVFEKGIGKLVDCIDKIKIEGSALNAQKEWLKYGPRKEKYKKVGSSDLTVYFNKNPISKIEIKRWAGTWNVVAFFKSKAHVNRSEVRDAAKLGGFIAFFIESEEYIHLLDAEKVKNAYENKQMDLVNLDEDCQGNYRWIITPKGKKELSITLDEAVQNIVKKSR